MSTKFLLPVCAVALFASTAFAQVPDSLSCVTMTTTNGKQHLVQLMNESPYWYKVQFCNDPEGRVTEVPKGQVVSLNSNPKQVPRPQSRLVDTVWQAPTLVDLQPQVSPKHPKPVADLPSNESVNFQRRRVAIHLKLPLWGRFEGDAQWFVQPHLAAGISGQNWSVSRYKTQQPMIGEPYYSSYSNHGHRVVAFFRVYQNRYDGAYASAGFVSGQHRIHNEKGPTNPRSSSDNYGSGMGGLNWNFDLFSAPEIDQSATVRVKGAEFRLGYSKIFESKLTFDIGLSWPLLKVQYLEQTDNYTYKPWPWLHCMFGMAF